MQVTEAHMETDVSTFHTRVGVLMVLAMTMSGAGGLARAHGTVEHAAPSARDDAGKVENTPFGRQGDPAKATRTIRIDMADTMRFKPADITVRRGETVKLVAVNKGHVLHELVLGTQDELKQHAEMMRKFPGMEHDEAHMTHVKPGHTGEIVWQFTVPGSFRFACLVPGHFEAGMVGRVTVR